MISWDDSCAILLLYELRLGAKWLAILAYAEGAVL